MGKEIEKKPYIFLGTSIRGRSPEEGEKIARNIGLIAEFLEEIGYGYDSSILTNTAIHSGSREQPEIPAEFLNMSKSLIDSVKGLRPYSDVEKIKTDIAVYRWSIALIKKSVGCIWEGSRSYAGLGVEVAEALRMERHCLILFDRPPHQTISSMIGGNMSRLLTIRQFKMNTYKNEILKFTKKIHGALDIVKRYNIAAEMREWIEQAVGDYGLNDESELVRYLITQDHEKRQSLREENNQ